jgi:Spx/MgsR family transcriptional regulator
MSITVYGIPNCDTVKKARAFLAERGLAHAFHDYKKQGVPQEALTRWVAEVGWERLLNRQGTTWRKLPAERQSGVHDAASAIALMTEQPSVIRRPVLVGDDQLLVGFNPDQWSDVRG